MMPKIVSPFCHHMPAHSFLLGHPPNYVLARALTANLLSDAEDHGYLPSPLAEKLVSSFFIFASRPFKQTATKIPRIPDKVIAVLANGMPRLCGYDAK